MESIGNIIVYVVIALAITVFSVLTVTTRKILRSATYLLFVLFATAGIYFQLDYHFLGAVQIAVYAGGIVVLFVFAILLTHKPGQDSDRIASHRRWAGIVAAVAAVGVCAYALLSVDRWCAKELPSMQELDITTVGRALLSTEKFGYLLPFEAVSVLLLACIIGGVVIARRR